METTPKELIRDIINSNERVVYKKVVVKDPQKNFRRYLLGITAGSLLIVATSFIVSYKKEREFLRERDAVVSQYENRLQAYASLEEDNRKLKKDLASLENRLRKTVDDAIKDIRTDYEIKLSQRDFDINDLKKQLEENTKELEGYKKSLSEKLSDKKNDEIPVAKKPDDLEKKLETPTAQKPKEEEKHDHELTYQEKLGKVVEWARKDSGMYQLETERALLYASWPENEKRYHPEIHSVGGIRVIQFHAGGGVWLGDIKEAARLRGGVAGIPSEERMDEIIRMMSNQSNSNSEKSDNNINEQVGKVETPIYREDLVINAANVYNSLFDPEIIKAKDKSFFGNLLGLKRDVQTYKFATMNSNDLESTLNRTFDSDIKFSAKEVEDISKRMTHRFIDAKEKDAKEGANEKLSAFAGVFLNYFLQRCNDESITLKSDTLSVYPNNLGSHLIGKKLYIPGGFIGRNALEFAKNCTLEAEWIGQNAGYNAEGCTIKATTNLGAYAGHLAENCNFEGDKFGGCIGWDAKNSTFRAKTSFYSLAETSTNCQFYRDGKLIDTNKSVGTGYTVSGTYPSNRVNSVSDDLTSSGVPREIADQFARDHAKMEEIRNRTGFVYPGLPYYPGDPNSFYHGTIQGYGPGAR